MNPHERQLSIWLITSEFPPVSGGGISTYCMETVKMFAAKGHKVTVFTPDTSVKQITEKEFGSYRLVSFHPDQSYTASFLGYETNLSFAFSMVIKQHLEREGLPDFLESQEYLGICYYILQFKHLGYSLFRDLRVIVTLHSPAFLYLEFNQVVFHRLPYYWVGEMERSCLVSADGLISPSRYLVDEVRARLKTLPQNIDIVVNPFRVNNNHSVTQGAGRIIFFGKLTPQKGVLEVLSYFEELWETGFNESFTMIGGGNHLYHPAGMDMVDFVRKKYQHRLRAGLLHIMGPINPADLEKEIGQARMVIIPSITDNLPYTVLEAMALGRIVLASVQGGQSEVITDGVNGFLFDHGQRGSFGRKLKEVLDLSESQATLIRAAARERIATGYNYELVYGLKMKAVYQILNLEPDRPFPFIQTPKRAAVAQVAGDRNSLLSVVIPYHNMARFIEDAVKSVKDCSYQNTEIIIINDGSTEPATDAILTRIAGVYGVKVINKQNEGLPEARNSGSTHAQGEFLAFLDADDTVAPDYYGTAIRVLEEKKNVFFVGCWAKYFGNSQGYWPAFNPEPPYVLVHNMINSSALVYRKDAFMQAGSNDSRMTFGMEDYDSVLSMVAAGYQGVVLPEPLWNYRIRKNSMARSFTRDKQLFLYRLIAAKHSDLFAEHASEVISILNANGPGIDYDNPSMLYNMPASGFLGTRVGRQLVRVVKANPVLRKAALKLKHKMKKR